MGPAELALSASIDGKQVYRRTLKIAIARRVDVSQESPSSTFGIHLSSAGIPYLADSVADIWGANWARVFLRWEVVEFEPGRYDWRRIDELVDLYRAQNIQILGVLGETAPKWAAHWGPERQRSSTSLYELRSSTCKTRLLIGTYTTKWIRNITGASSWTRRTRRLIFVCYGRR